MASIRPSIDHTLIHWLINHLNNSPFESAGDKIIASQVIDIYNNALQKAGLGNISLVSNNTDNINQSNQPKSNPVTLNDVKIKALPFPFDTDLTINAPDDIKSKAIQAVAATFNTDPKPDRSKDPIAGMWNNQMCSYYQAQVLSIQATGEIITGSISESEYNKPISPIDKTLNIGITASEL